MDGHEVFALAFIVVAVLGLPIAVFLECGLDTIAKLLVKYIDSHNKKEKDKDI